MGVTGPTGSAATTNNIIVSVTNCSGTLQAQGLLNISSFTYTETLFSDNTKYIVSTVNSIQNSSGFAWFSINSINYNSAPVKILISEPYYSNWYIPSDSYCMYGIQNGQGTGITSNSDYWNISFNQSNNIVSADYYGSEFSSLTTQAGYMICGPTYNNGYVVGLIQSNCSTTNF